MTGFENRGKDGETVSLIILERLFYRKGAKNAKKTN